MTTLNRGRAAFARQQGDIAASYPRLRYLYNAPAGPEVAYTVAKPPMFELLGWNCRHGKLALFSKARVFLGFRIAMPSWSDCYVGVTKDKFYFYRALDDTSARPDFVFDLEDLLIEDLGESEGRPFAFRVNELRGSVLVLACATRDELDQWLHVLRNGSTAFRENAEQIFHDKAATAQRIVRGFLQRRRYIKLRRQHRAAVKIQAVYRGHRHAARYRRMMRSAIVIQAIVRMHLAKQERARLKLEGNIVKYHQKRTFIFREILSTEESFVLDMTTCVDVYLKGLRVLMDPNMEQRRRTEDSPASPSPAHKASVSMASSSPSSARLTRQQTEGDMSNAETVSRIFSNIEDILALHQRFLGVLRTLEKDWSEQAKVAHAFLDMTNELDIYETYAINYDDAMTLLEKMKKNNKTFRDFLERVSDVPRVKKLDLTGFLLGPIQRLPRYVLLLKDLVKNTWPEHPDRLDLSEALTRMQKAVSYLNDAKRMDENIKRTKSLLQKFREPAQVQEILNSPDVVCIYEGPVASVSGSRAGTGPDPSNSQKSWLLLFSDQLIVTQRNNSRKKVVQGKGAAYVNTVRFNNPVSITIADLQEDAAPFEDKKHPFGFTVCSEQLVFRFFAKTEEARRKWIGEINAARKNLVVWNYSK